MDLTISEIISASTVLQKLGTKELPARSAYRLARLLSAVDDVLKPWHDQRRRLVQMYGVERPATIIEKRNGADDVVLEVIPGSNGWNVFQQELKTLLSETVNIAVTPLSLDDLPSVSAADVLALGNLVEDGVPTKQ